MDETARAIGVVLAGGRGSRFGSDRPKQFHILAGRMVVEYPVAAFMDHPGIDEVIVVHPAGFETEVAALRNRFAGRKSLRLVAGGSSRPGSTRAALRAIPAAAGNCKILFHDGARPFLTRAIIGRCLRALDHGEAVATVVPATDTIVMLDEDGNWLETIPPRARLRRNQTPQGFRRQRITDAYEALSDDELGRFTDDCGVLLARFSQTRILAVDGDETNIKITSPMDMLLAERLMLSAFSARPQPDGAIGQGVVDDPPGDA